MRAVVPHPESGLGIPTGILQLPPEPAARVALPLVCVAVLGSRFCDLRNGTIVAERSNALHDLLRRIVHARLAISNPDYAGPKR